MWQKLIDAINREKRVNRLTGRAFLGQTQDNDEDKGSTQHKRRRELWCITYHLNKKSKLSNHMLLQKPQKNSTPIYNKITKVMVMEVKL